MKRAFSIIHRAIVGPEYGFSGEGNIQWYYSLSVAINLMLIWWLKPEIAILFTTLVIIHGFTVFTYGFFELDYCNSIWAYIYAIIHFIILANAIFTNFKWTIITIAITIGAMLLAPDCTGNNIFLEKPNVDNRLLLLCNTIIFAVFVVVDLLLPISGWIKIIIISVAIIAHPIIDWLEGECIIISDITYDVIYKIMDDLASRKNH